MFVKVFIDDVSQFFVFVSCCIAALGTFKIIVAVLLLAKVVTAEVGHFEVFLDHGLVMIRLLSKI